MMRIARLAVLSLVSLNSGVAFAHHDRVVAWVLLAGAAVLAASIASAEEHRDHE